MVLETSLWSVSKPRGTLVYVPNLQLETKLHYLLKIKWPGFSLYRPCACKGVVQQESRKSCHSFKLHDSSWEKVRAKVQYQAFYYENLP